MGAQATARRRIAANDAAILYFAIVSTVSTAA